MDDELLRIGDLVRNLENGHTAVLIQFEDRDYATVAYDDDGEIRSVYVGALEKIRAKEVV